MPKVVSSLPHRSPNLPPLTKMACSPGARRFTTAASIAPVPVEASRMTSSLVPNSGLRRSRDLIERLGKIRGAMVNDRARHLE